MDAVAKKAKDVNRRFTEKLSAAVACAGSKSEIARAANIHPAVLDKYLAGSTPKPGTTYALAKALRVSPAWLINDEAPVEPVVPWSSQSLRGAPWRDIVRECDRQYVEALARQKDLIAEGEAYGDNWERSAMWVAMPHDPAYLPDPVVEAIELSEQLLECYQLLEAFVNVFDADRENTEEEIRRYGLLYPQEVEGLGDEARRNKLWKEHPGFGAIYSYVEATRYPTLGRKRQTAQQFVKSRGDYWLARIINTPGVADHPQKDQIIESLRERKLVDDSGKPVPLPRYFGASDAEADLSLYETGEGEYER